MQLQVGKKYVTRGGRIVGPLAPNGSPSDVYPLCIAVGSELAWMPNGDYWLDGTTSDYDIVAEYVEPVPLAPDAPMHRDYAAASINGPAGADWRELAPGVSVDEVPRELTVELDASDPYSLAAIDALNEVRRARAMFPKPANSAHEQFAVMDEECDELLDAAGVERLCALMASRRVARRGRRAQGARMDQPETPRPSRDAQGGDPSRRDGAAICGGMLRRDDGTEMTPRIALVVTYYNNPGMLARQIAEWAKYPKHVAEHFRFVIVDDGSALGQAASDVLIDLPYDMVRKPNVSLFRIDDDIPWNQHGARNLAARECHEPWLLMLDIDHVLTAEDAESLACLVANDLLYADEWHTFPRERIGRADSTRLKDSTLRGIDPAAQRALVNPALNCYLATREAYWLAGGYNEDFCGTYGGDTQFLRELRKVEGDPIELEEVTLRVHTRDSVPDANERLLDRDPEPFRERLAAARRAGTVRGHEPYCRFKWRRVL